MSAGTRAWRVFALWAAAAIFAATLAGSLTFAQQNPAASAAQQPRPANLDRNGTLILIRTTLIALDQANKTANYSVLHTLSAPGFQANNSPQRLAEIFARQRAQGLDLAGVVAIDPQLTLLPQIEANGMLHVAGFFPSVPAQVYFELLFAPVDGHWKPFGISVDLRSSTPTAPAQSQAPTQPKPTQPAVQRR